MTKPTKIRYLTEIDTSRAYMLGEHLIYFPKAPNRGWLRGDVAVTGFQTLYQGVYEALVVAKQVLTDKSLTLLVRRNGAASLWEFPSAKINQGQSVYLAPPSWKEDLLNKSLLDIMSLEKEIAKIHNQMSRIKNNALY